MKKTAKKALDSEVVQTAIRQIRDYYDAILNCILRRALKAALKAAAYAPAYNHDIATVFIATLHVEALTAAYAHPHFNSFLLAADGSYVAPRLAGKALKNINYNNAVGKEARLLAKVLKLQAIEELRLCGVDYRRLESYFMDNRHSIAKILSMLRKRLK
jgi:hypothetical protein